MYWIYGVAATRLFQKYIRVWTLTNEKWWVLQPYTPFEKHEINAALILFCLFGWVGGGITTLLNNVQFFSSLNRRSQRNTNWKYSWSDEFKPKIIKIFWREKIRKNRKGNHDQTNQQSKKCLNIDEREKNIKLFTANEDERVYKKKNICWKQRVTCHTFNNRRPTPGSIDLLSSSAVTPHKRRLPTSCIECTCMFCCSRYWRLLRSTSWWQLSCAPLSAMKSATPGLSPPNVQIATELSLHAALESFLQAF